MPLDDVGQARAIAVIVPTRSAAALLQRTIEDRLEPGQAVVLPDLLTRRDWYERLAASRGSAAELARTYERDVLMEAAAHAAITDGATPPFHLQLGARRRGRRAVRRGAAAAPGRRVVRTARAGAAGARGRVGRRCGRRTHVAADPVSRGDVPRLRSPARDAGRHRRAHAARLAHRDAVGPAVPTASSSPSRTRAATTTASGTPTSTC